VIRGNLLAIPVDQSLLYFEPIYLKAEKGALPELKRVIVAFKDTIVMRQTLPEALEAVFGSRSSSPRPASGTASGASPSAGSPNPALSSGATSSELVQSAIEAYEQGQKALQSGDWAAYGQFQQRLEQALQQLDGTLPDPTAPAPTTSPPTSPQNPSSENSLPQSKPPQVKPVPTKPTSGQP
jgi:uncharacterized protein